MVDPQWTGKTYVNRRKSAFLATLFPLATELTGSLPDALPDHSLPACPERGLFSGVDPMPKVLRWLCACLAAVAFAVPAHAAVPAQFIAKLYTEALGRAPEAGGWASRVNDFSVNGCTGARLASHGIGVFNSDEFNAKGYSNAAKLLLLYRTALDREPDSGGFNAYLNMLNSGTPFSSVVNSFYASGEFNQLVARMCSGAPYYFNTLGYGGYAIQIPGVAAVTQADLQASLNATPAGGTVALPAMTVVYLNSTLNIPANVTLATAGNPDPGSHGMMARLVRAPGYASPGSALGEALVKLNSGSRLTNMWIDGQRGAGVSVGGVPRPYVKGEINIQSLSGANTQIVSNFIANTAGWSSMQVLGMGEVGVPCVANAVMGNVITAYASSNADTAGQTWADGISDSCEDSQVVNNHIVDATDGGIVLFRSQINGNEPPQHSQVTDNIILNAGNSAFIAIAVDPLYGTPVCPVSPNFAGSYVGRNAFWTGPNAIIEIGLAVGTSEWFFNHGGCLGSGANVSDNTSNGFRVRVNDGIAIQGMLNATVQSNNLLTTRVRKGSCGSYDVSAGISAGIASGSLQPYTDVALKSCI
ncbi:MAG: DUF4214 domain-containing protein [Sphingomonadales bacterium]|nr:DUF4214 domain-containing protein [Sphingomonadales bacterium]